MILPGTLCNIPNGKTLDIKGSLNKLSQGFLWGFCYKENGQELDFEKFKTPLISKQTLFLDKSKGGVNLIDYLTKMKSFRILLVYKYLKNEGSKQWMGILKYWYSVNLHSITNERWDHNYPHMQNINEIPHFFRKCLTEFKEYYARHGSSISENINSKQIYENILLLL